MKKITVSEADIAKMVKNVINEMYDNDDDSIYLGRDYFKPNPEFDMEEEEPDLNLSDLLEDCGWGYFGVQDMPDGRVAYRCGKHSPNSMEWEDVKSAVSSVFGDKASFGSATNKYAPEQKYQVVYIKYDNDDEEI